MSKTADERMNDLEDQNKKLKDALNHNNAVARKVKAAQDKRIAELEARLLRLEKEPNQQFAFGDIINNAMKGKKP